MKKNFIIKNKVKDIKSSENIDDINKPNELMSKLAKYKLLAQKGKEWINNYKKENEINYDKFKKLPDTKKTKTKGNTFLTNTKFKKNKKIRPISPVNLDDPNVVKLNKTDDDPIKELKDLIITEEDDLAEIRRMINEVDIGLNKQKKEFSPIEDKFFNLNNDIKKKKYNKFIN